MADNKRSFESNRLDDYNQTTYHLKLFMLPEDKATARPFNSEDGIIIAESGVTGKIFINELNFTSYISLNGTTRNATAVDFNLSLREFSGSTLMDSIFAASLDLGVQNYMKAPYFLEISFRARDPGSDKHVTPSKMKWVWPLTIQGVETDVDEGGSSYSIKAHHYNHMAQRKPFVSIDKAIALKDVGTVKDAVAELQKKLSERSTEKAITTYSYPDEYEIIFPAVGGNIENKIADFTLRDSKTTDGAKAVSVEAGKATDISLTTITIEKNSSIIDAINNILTNTSKYQEMAKQSESSNDQAKDGKAIKVLHKVDTKVTQLNYDITRGDYQRKFTFEIFPYEMGTLQTSPNETSGETSTVRYNKYKDSGILEKRYNYLFTGENDQVLEYNIKFNQAWYVNMPTQGGLYTQSFAANEAQHFDETFDKYIKLREEIMASIKNMSSDNTGLKQNTTELQTKIAASDLPEEQKAQLNNLLRTQSRSRLKSDGEKSEYDKGLQARTDTGNGKSSGKTPKSRFVSDYRLDEALKSANVQTKFRLVPLTYRETSKDKDDNNMQKGSEANSGGGREYVNSLFNQAFTGRSGDLVNLDMKIKGDPYWLGPANSEEPVPTGGKGAQVFLLFTTKTPEIPNVSTGVIDTRPTALNGVYGVKMVEHTFSDGLFTQQISGVRDPLINISQIQEIPE